LGFRNLSKKTHKEIQKELPRAIVILYEGSPKSFEIKVDNKLVFSRQKTLRFPNLKELLQVIKHQAFGIPQDLENYKFKKTHLSFFAF
jgi:selT/selW/selH-like putative selenoprotein